MGGLFGDLPPPSEAAEKDDASKAGSVTGKGPMGLWSVSSRMAPSALLKPMFAPPSTVRRAHAQAQAQASSTTSSPASASASAAAAAAMRAKQQQSTQGTPLSTASEAEGSSRSSDNETSGSGGVYREGTNGGVGAAGVSGGVSMGSALVAAAASVLDEYDPATPNDYEQVLRERKRKRVEEEMERERERRRKEGEERERERERELQRQRDIQLAMEKEKERVTSALAAAASAAGPEESVGGRATSVMSADSGEEAWRRRAALSGGIPSHSSASVERGQRGHRRSPSPPRGYESTGMGEREAVIEKSMTAAERMMMKMGWKAGQGLGKQEQGITTPLMARKTDKRAGVIVNAPEKGNNNKGTGTPGQQQQQGQQQGGQQQQQQQQQQQEQGNVGATALVGPPTKVVLLKNMVGPGEVDEELKEEVAAECVKYGEVQKVLIFEITESDFPPEEAVRIFVAFQRLESAVKAAVDFNGRFFGGRALRAAYFDEQRFAHNELAPSAEELEQIQR